MTSIWEVEHVVPATGDGTCPRCKRRWSKRTRFRFRDGKACSWREHCEPCGVQWEGRA